MTTLSVESRRRIEAPADVVYRCIADQALHARFLPPAFSEFEVISGGVGEGTVTRFALTTAGRTRRFRMRLAEPEPGRVLIESDTGSALVTAWRLTPEGRETVVALSTAWDSAPGLAGVFERLLAPSFLRGLYADELERLDAFAVALVAGDAQDG